jgi:CRISPR-associated endoribonuclease Cas6/Csy4 subtype I-F
MAFSHYVDLMIREGTVAHELHARLLLAVHQKVAAGETLAVTWPDWRSRPGEFGLIFRVFGSEEHLASYLKTVGPLSVAELMRFYPVLPVPETSSVVRFVRDRSHDKLSPTAARRLARRAAERGEIWQSTHNGKPREAGDHYLTIPSSSQQQVFRFYILRDGGTGTDPAGASYGLGHALPEF